RSPFTSIIGIASGGAIRLHRKHGQLDSTSIPNVGIAAVSIPRGSYSMVVNGKKAARPPRVTNRWARSSLRFRTEKRSTRHFGQQPARVSHSNYTWRDLDSE